jgi:hypothetical protein
MEWGTVFILCESQPRGVLRSHAFKHRKVYIDSSIEVLLTCTQQILENGGIAQKTVFVSPACRHYHTMSGKPLNL